MKKENKDTQSKRKSDLDSPLKKDEPKDLTNYSEYEDIYKKLVESSLQGIIIAQGLPPRLVYANPAISKILGYTPDELTSLSIDETDSLIHPEDRYEFFKRYQERLEGKLSSASIVFRGIRKDGSSIWLEGTGTRIEYQNQPAVLATFIEITERKHAEQQLIKRSQFQQLITTLSTNFINISSKEIDSEIHRTLQKIGEFAEVDRSYVFLFAETFEKINNTHEWCAPGIEPQIQRLQQIEIDREFPFFAKTIKNREVFHVPRVAELSENARAEKREFGRQKIQSLICVPMVCQDQLIGFLGLDSVRREKSWPEDIITLLKTVGEMIGSAIVRKRAEEALRASEERYKTIIESIEDGYFEVNLAGDLTFFNDSLCRILGYSREEMLGMSNRQYTDEENRKKLYEAFNKVYRTGQPTRAFAWEIIRKDGMKRFGEVSITLMKNSKGEPIGFRGTARDVTERKKAEQEIQQTLSLLNATLESTADGILVVDLNGKIVSYNQKFVQLWHIPDSVIVSRNEDQALAYVLDQLKDPNGFLDKVRALYAQPEAENYDVIEFKDGRRFERFSTPHRIGDQIVGRVWCFRDVTNHLQAEEALARSEERYRMLVEESFDGIFIQRGAEIIFANRRLHEMLGYEEGELLGMNHWRVYHPNYQSLTRKRAEARLRGESPPSTYEVKFQRKDGSSFWGEINAKVIHFLGGPGIQVWARDISERKLAEEILQAEKERFQSLSEGAPFGMVMISQDGRFKYMNPKFKELFGYDLRDIPDGKTWFRKAYPDPDYRRQVIGTWLTDHTVSKPGAKVPRVFTVRCKDGTEKIINFISVYLQSGETLMTCEDITELKRAEEALRQTEEQLRHSQKMEAVGKLAGGVAHDFNNLLTVIKGYAELSCIGLEESDPLRINLEEIRKASERAASLTRQLLAFSRRQILDLKIVNLNTLLKDLDKMLHRIMGEDIELVYHLSQDLGMVKTDPGQMEQVILNLAVNARDAMPSGGKLTIETFNVELDEAYSKKHMEVTPGQYIMLSVSDSGIGISPEVKDRIFDPFFTTKEKGKGTGLGLSMVYGIVKQSGGNIYVYSEPGHGTTFKIYLPKIEAEEENLQLQPESTRTLPKGNENILLAEDETSVRELTARILREHGYQVFEAQNGMDILNFVKSHREKEFHLLVTDVVMPIMSGKELENHLKPLIPGLKVIFISGYTDNAIVHHGVLMEGVEFLQKPFTHHTLLNKVREVLDR